MSIHECPCCTCAEEEDDVDEGESHHRVIPPPFYPPARTLSVEEMREAVKAIWDQYPTLNRINMPALITSCLYKLNVKDHEYRNWNGQLTEFIKSEYVVKRGKDGGVYRPGTTSANTAAIVPIGSLGDD